VKTKTKPPAEPPPGVDRPLLLAEVAAVLRCTPRKVNQMVAAGTFPAATFRVGRSPRWASAAVNRFVNGEDR
jgi:hypothetical protein